MCGNKSDPLINMKMLFEQIINFLLKLGKKQTLITLITLMWSYMSFNVYQQYRHKNNLIVELSENICDVRIIDALVSDIENILNNINIAQNMPPKLIIKNLEDTSSLDNIAYMFIKEICSTREILTRTDKDYIKTISRDLINEHAKILINNLNTFVEKTKILYEEKVIDAAKAQTESLIEFMGNLYSIQSYYVDSAIMYDMNLITFLSIVAAAKDVSEINLNKEIFNNLNAYYLNDNNYLGGSLECHDEIIEDSLRRAELRLHGDFNGIYVSNKRIL